MGDISRQIDNLYAQAIGVISAACESNGYKRNFLASIRQAKECFDKIAALQAKCSHTWHFNRQDSTGDGEHWNVAYKCSECNSERRERKPPVCESCDGKLEQAHDREAEHERIKVRGESFKNPMSFRCSRCRRIHILWYEMD